MQHGYIKVINDVSAILTFVCFMLDFIVSGAIAWFDTFTKTDGQLQPLKLLPWEESVIFELPPNSDDLVTETLVEAYLQNLTARNLSAGQGIWVQSDWNILASNRGKIPLPTASLTKIATTLAALSKWGVQHQFTTDIYVTGELENGIIMGDLIVRGTGDPLFVWEEAIALGNALNQLGIEEIRGDILVSDRFYMNYEARPLAAGELFKQALDRQLWSSETTRQYLQMPAGPKQPEIAIAGRVRAVNFPTNARLLIRHRSLPLAEILRQMNIYSNNSMAQMLADLVGGADRVARISAEIADFPTSEIELINGSGLGEENRISPRAVCKMLMAIDRLLQSHSFSAADLFPTAGRDLVGTVQDRGLPTGTTIKTGTLNRVSALAGVIPTSDRGNVYFSIINYGSQIEYFRQQQDRLLNELVQTWQLIPNNFNLAEEKDWYLGDPKRNRINTLN